MLKLFLPVFVSLVGISLAGIAGGQEIPIRRFLMEGFQVTPQSQVQVDAIIDFFDRYQGYYLQSPRPAVNRKLEILVQKDFKMDEFQEAMRNVGIDYSVLYERVKIKMYPPRGRPAQDNGHERPSRTISSLPQSNTCGGVGASCTNSSHSCCSGYSCQFNPFASNGTCISDIVHANCGNPGAPCFTSNKCCSRNCRYIGGHTGGQGYCA